MSLQVTPLSPVVGAEVSGIDLREPLDDATVAELRAALLEHLVLFFRGQDIDDDQHVEFARRFGPISIPAFLPKGTERPEVMVLDQTDARGQGADRWHSDNTFMAEPPLGSVLRAIHVPDVGGDTAFASMYAAYESLSDRMQRFLDGMTAIHDITPLLENAVRRGISDADVNETRQKWPAVIHPLVRTHPETGRKGLYVNPNATVLIRELSDAESRSVLDLLFDHIKSPEHQCRFRWTTGSVAFWDNRAAQHYGVADYRERRIMRRVTIAGDEPR